MLCGGYEHHDLTRNYGHVKNRHGRKQKNCRDSKKKKKGKISWQNSGRKGKEKIKPLLERRATLKATKQVKTHLETQNTEVRKSHKIK